MNATAVRRWHSPSCSSWPSRFAAVAYGQDFAFEPFAALDLAFQSRVCHPQPAQFARERVAPAVDLIFAIPV